MPILTVVIGSIRPGRAGDGRFHANDVLEQAATAMLDELLRLDGALRPLRAATATAAL
jgi:hypothetical protein